MKQATSQITRLAAVPGKELPAGSAATRFVINLCASTTPVGLVQPEHPSLKRFTFFVSRRREEGRERFRLHMGYFASEQEAEKVLELVRDVYPAAWVGLAPGQRPSAQPAAATLAGPAVVVPAAPKAAVMHDAPVKLELVADVPRALPQQASDPRDVISGAQVLHLLEKPAAAAPRPTPSSPAPMRAPTGTPTQAAQRTAVPTPTPRVAMRSTAPAAAPGQAPAFAVQLLWSVQPIDMTQVPRLAIFAAYRLYGAEGNREGRRWYGLRLGFFKDAMSARQVAQYVRSEFKSVSVVPVSANERISASTAPARPLPPTPTAKGSGHELNFIEDVPTDNATSGSRPALQPTAAPAPPASALSGTQALAAAAGPLVAAREPPGKRAKLRVGQDIKPASRHSGHGHGRDRTGTLEQTLEVLGASSLQIQEHNGERLNDVATRDRDAAQAKRQRSSRFGRMIEKLAERFGA